MYFQLAFCLFLNELIECQVFLIDFLSISESINRLSSVFNWSFVFSESILLLWKKLKQNLLPIDFQNPMQRWRHQEQIRNVHDCLLPLSKKMNTIFPDSVLKSA
jgi:hypothetical protein